jgi:hypothetical protein
MVPFADAVVMLWLVSRPSVSTPGGATTSEAPLHTFVVQKPPAERTGEGDAIARLAQIDAPKPPRSVSRLSGIAGIGYVQHADWGAELLAAGSIKGLEVQFAGLVTYGSQGARFDNGTLTAGDPDRGWRADAGDLYSDLRGPVRGVRVSWLVKDRWQPGLSLDGARAGSLDRRMMLVYRDRLRLGPVSLDGEVAMDGASFVRMRYNAGHRFDVETSFRRGTSPVPGRDAGIQVGLRVWRDLSFSAGLLRSERPGDRSEWRTIAVHVPIYRHFGLTLERTFTTTNRSSDVLYAAMVNVHAGSFVFYHRYQWGQAEFFQPGLGTISRDQLQSMASYAMGRRVNVTLQMASQWGAAGLTQNWLEVQTDVRVTRRTSLQIATPMPGAYDTDRIRVRLDQGLPGRFSLFAEYGRPSAYQGLEDGAEQPRFRLMIRRSWSAATPSRGGQVRGYVIDYTGRPVAGARVRLGPYSADSDTTGAYVFTHVPRGDHYLSLDPNLLPADYAWDGRVRHMSVTSSTRASINLMVAPLNAIHGRVYADRNSNSRYDAGEGVAGAVLALAERVTATGADGAYDFYNVMPGSHEVRLDAARLPSLYEMKSLTALPIELRDDRPVTGADFVVATKSKTVIWREIK